MAINAKIDLKKPVLEEISAQVKSVKVKVDGVPQKMYVCTSCLRSGKVERA